MEASSIFYVNSSSAIVHYIFATISAMLVSQWLYNNRSSRFLILLIPTPQGFIVIVSYVINGEIQFVTPMLDKFQWKPKLNDNEITSEPVKGNKPTSLIVSLRNLNDPNDPNDPGIH